MGILGNNPYLALGNPGTGYQLQQSLRFNSEDSAYLDRTPSSVGNRKTWTFSVWLKRGILGAQQGIFCPVLGGDGSNESQIRFLADDRLQVYDSGGSPDKLNVVTTQRFRDTSAWYHIVIACDTTQSTATDRLKFYVNGSQVTDFDTTQWPDLDEILGWNGTSRHDIGRYAAGASNYFPGYMAEIHQIDGTQLDPTSFGEEDEFGVWRPIDYTGGSYGTNGFYLKFDPSATNGIGHDHSGNGNNFTANNFATSGTGTDVMSDTPTTNWCTLNPLSFGPSNADLIDGSLRFNTPTSSFGNAKGTIAVSSGKWYWEVTPQTTATANVAGGILGAAETSIASQPGEYATGYAYLGNGERSNNSTETSYGDTYGADDVIGTALDLEAGTLVFYKNGVSQGTAFSGLSGTFVPAVGDTSSTSGVNLLCNFGQREFEYTPPLGFKALNTSNLPTPEIQDGSKYFKTVLYTGTVTDTSTQSVTGVGFKSDWTWIKRRDSGNSHQLVDAVRGTGRWLETNSNNLENSTNTNGVLTSFDADGFTLTGGSTNANLCCEDGFTYASWNWLAGNSTSSNTDGTISSTVSVNRKAGLSIVTYTGTGVNATVGHGLGVQPSFYVVKPRSESNNWPCWHRDLTSDQYYIHLNFALKQDLASAVWNGTGPSSTVFNIGTNTNVNQDEATFVAYVFAEVPGYSRISSYPGNGSTTGPFIWTGFRPSYLLIKNYRGGSETNWLIRDSARAPFNQMQAFLYANTDVGEGNNFPIDFLSNGFKIRDDNAIFNESGSDFLFLAFAENPFGGFRTTPVTAR